MKRFFFISTLLLIVTNQNLFAKTYECNASFKRGALEYTIDYTDSLKQEVKDFWVWYKPEKYKDLLADKVAYKENLKITNQRARDFIKTIENLFIKEFGSSKVFNKKGSSNIKAIIYSVHISTGQVYLRAIVFTGGAYNLITDEDILSFAREFNKNISLHLNDKNETGENAMKFYNGLYLFTSREEN